jgi:hypothetical protein
MQRMRSCHGVKGPPLFFLWVVGRGGFNFSSCVWCGEWTVNFPSKPFLFFLGRADGVQSKEFPSSWHVPSYTLVFKVYQRVPSQLHLTFIPFALATFVLLSREGSLYFKIGCYILGSLYNFIFWGDGPIKLDHCPRKKQNKSNIKTLNAPRLINRTGE